MPRWISFTLTALLLIVSSMSIIAQATNARVIDMSNTLNVRAEPSGRATIVAELAGQTDVNVVARTSTNRWYQITTTDGAVTGWAASDFVDLNVFGCSVILFDPYLAIFLISFPDELKNTLPPPYGGLVKL